jgi:hypothetical protein
MLFSEAIFLRLEKKKKVMMIILLLIVIAHHDAQNVGAVLHLVPGFAEGVVHFLSRRFHFEYLWGFFVKILLQPSQQK